jgi:hypothetical protein
MRKNNVVKNGILAITSFLLTASFVFADSEAMPIPLPDEVFIVENDQSVQKTERVATIEYRPSSSAYVVRGQVQYRDVEGTAYLEMWNVMPDGKRYFSRTLEERGTMRPIQGSSDWRYLDLPFYLMDYRPESVTLEINVVMPGKGTIELTDLSVRDMLIFLPGGGEWFDVRTSGIIGATLGTLGGCFGALIGILCGFLVPRGKGRRLVLGMIVFIFIMGVIHLVIGISALCHWQPYHVWYPFVLTGGLLVVIPPIAFSAIRKQYEQAELRKLQALDA